MATNVARIMTQTFETIYVKTDRVACDGDKDGLHPRVFLDVSKTGEVTCPYCSRNFVREK